jgi:TonB-linked SusC/RagA family outer membrane protein
MTWSGGYYFGKSGGWKAGIATGYPGNPDVEWESSRKTNIGIELGLLNDLKIQADYFVDKREGIYILQESVPSVVGININPYVNLGKMENRGVDGSLEYMKQIGKWSLSARANFTFNRNKKLYDDKPTPIWAYQEEVNEPYNQFRGLIALGLFESEQDIADSPTQTFDTPVVGDIKYKDINGDGMINDYDRVAIGYTTIPEINYGFGLSAGWKGFDLSVFFQGTDHVSRIIGGNPLYGSGGSILVNGQIYADVAENRWTLRNPDPNAKYPRLSMLEKNNNKQASTYWLRDMSYIRLKNAEFGYTIPKRISQKTGASTIRFYLQGVNLLTVSKFKLWDPELDTNWGDVYPNMRTISLGLNVNF